MTLGGLLTGYLASGQTPAGSSAATQNMLFWFVAGLLALVVLVVLLMGSMMAVQIRPHYQQGQPAPSPTSEAAPTKAKEEVVC
jgi:heme/copper-type cytochrome/quinol oxidase subunit 2